MAYSSEIGREIKALMEESRERNIKNFCKNGTEQVEFIFANRECMDIKLALLVMENFFKTNKSVFGKEE